MGVSINFQDVSDSSTLNVNHYYDGTNEVLIELNITNPEYIGGGGVIHLDVETAVKFAKELRKQIAIAKDYQLKSETNE